MPSRDEVDTKERADRALRSGQPAESLLLYRSLLTRAVVMEPGLYESWLEGTGQAYRALGKHRHAACVLMGLGRHADAAKLLSAELHPVEWALCMAETGQHDRGAKTVSAAGYPVLAAILREHGKDFAGARAQWQSLLTNPRLRARPYETALCQQALARVLRIEGDADAARAAAIESVRLLETLADEFETRGVRERAFDCFCLILQLGREHGSFENVSEGYSNAIRILMAEYDPYVPLQYTDDFIATAVESLEWQTAALASLDAAEYCRRMSLAHERYYLARACRLWRESARHIERSGLQAELAENALQAALDAAASLPDLPMLGTTYEALSRLPLPVERKERYAALAARYLAAGEPVAGETGLPDHLRQPNPYPDIGTQDLAEWELQGDAAATLLRILVDQAHYVRFRRQALRALLIALDREGSDGDIELAAALGNVPLYQVLAPLERLFASPVPELRVQVMVSVGQILNKRSFHLVRIGLDDSDERVREAARRSLRGLKFRDGLEPLVRIYRETRDQIVCETALAAIADVGTVQAAQFLLEIVREGTPVLRALAADRLSTFRVTDVLPLVHSALEFAVGAEKQALEGVVTALQPRPV